ncbi:MAG: glycosyltransferase family 2 protein [Ramlibacter sp.]
MTESLARLPGLSVVVPAYNSQQSLGQLVDRLQPVLAAHADDYEIIFVNDGSRDGTSGVIESLAREHDWIRPIDLMRNSGQHNALLCGIRHARFPVVVTMDDDLQNPPDQIPVMLAALVDGVDVVYGAPASEVHGVLRNLASQVTKIVIQGALGAETARMVGPFRVFRTSVRNAFSEYRGTYVNIDVLLTWGTTRVRGVRVRHDARAEGRSNYTFWTLLRHSLNMLTGFSVLPLQLASFAGFCLTLVGVGLLAFVIARYFMQGVAVPGFAFLASITIIFAGAQLATLGIIGEYLARMHFRLMERPSYTVRVAPADPPVSKTR